MVLQLDAGTNEDIKDDPTPVAKELRVAVKRHSLGGFYPTTAITVAKQRGEPIRCRMHCNMLASARIESVRLREGLST